MDWKRESMDELRHYRARKVSIESLIDEISELESGLSSIGGNQTGDGIHTGTSDPDEKIVNKLVKIDKLKKSLSIARKNIKSVETGLSICTTEERHILDMFYIRPAKGNVDKLCDELCCEQSTVYRKKDQALKTYTIARYGITEII